MYRRTGRAFTCTPLWTCFRTARCTALMTASVVSSLRRRPRPRCRISRLCSVGLVRTRGGTSSLAGATAFARCLMTSFRPDLAWPTRIVVSVPNLPKCGERSDIFGHGGARNEAENLGVPFLGEIPLHMDIRSNSDGGTPITISAPDSQHAKIFCGIADQVMDRIQAESDAAARPQIVFE